MDSLNIDKLCAKVALLILTMFMIIISLFRIPFG